MSFIGSSSKLIDAMLDDEIKTTSLPTRKPSVEWWSHVEQSSHELKGQRWAKVPPFFSHLAHCSIRAGRRRPSTKQQLQNPKQHRRSTANIMSSIKTVRQLKEDLLKEFSRPGGDGRSEKIMDIVQRLDNVDMDLAILTGTLVGASVSKLKNHDDVHVSSMARKLVRKWKGIAKLGTQEGGGNDDVASASSSSSSSASASTAKPAASSAGGDGKKGSPKPGQLKRVASAGSSSDLGGESEWRGLPQFRINICRKLHGIFLLSVEDLSRELNGSAVGQLCLARAGEVEAAIDAWSRGERGGDTYTDKVRDLVFNLKKNGPLREQVILGQISPKQLPRMSAGELQTEEKAKEQDDTLKKLQDSRR
jgi:hypothetical protein